MIIFKIFNDKVEMTIMEKKLLHIEDSTGEDFEFELTLEESVWKDFSRLHDIAKKILLDQKNDNDIINIEVLTLN